MRGSHINLSFGSEIIYDDAEFQINGQDKVGVVGVNGAGKTTLFRLLLKEIKPDSGELDIGKARAGYLPQEIVLEDENMTVWDYLNDGRPLRKINAELAEVYKRLETAGEAEHPALLEKVAKLQEELD